MGLVVLIDRPGWQLSSDQKVLLPQEARLVQESADALSAAEVYASRLLHSALKVFEFRADRGFQDGNRRAAIQSATRLAQLEGLRTRMIQALQPTLVELLMDALSRLAHGLERQRLHATALGVLEDAWRAARWARLRVHPGHVAAAQAAVAALSANAGAPVCIEVLPDAELGLDDCRFESDLGCADAGLETQLAALRDAFSLGLAEWSDDAVSTPDAGAPVGPAAEVA